jgi:hypothetical protein
MSAAEGSLAALQEDIRAAWVPDVAGGLDLAAYLSGRQGSHGPAFQRLEVPKADGEGMSIHVLHPAWHAALHCAADGLREKIDASLREGVFGYRRGADSSSSYSDQWLAFSDYTAERSQTAEWVVLADVADFFQSLSWIRVTESLAEVDSAAVAPVLRIAADLDRCGLACLPSGYADARLLGNAVLSLVDRRLDVPVARWVDDYRLFVPPGRDPEAVLGALRDALGEIGLRLNEQKTEVVPGVCGERASHNALSSVYHPDRDPPDAVRENLHRTFYEVLDEPTVNRRKVRFLLPRLAEQRDDVALSFAFHGLSAFPWDAPRLVSYISTFAERREVVFLVNAHLASAARDGDGWIVSRLAPLACHVGISDFAAEALEGNIDALAHTPAWGMALRALAMRGRESAVEIATAPDSPDPRAALVALRDLGRAFPDHLREVEPVLSSLLHQRAPLPRTDTIL